MRKSTYLWRRGQTEYITGEFPGNSKKTGHVLDFYGNLAGGFELWGPKIFRKRSERLVLKDGTVESRNAGILKPGTQNY